MEEFNKQFRDIIVRIYEKFSPPHKYLLVYYIEALSEEMRYQLRDKESTDLKNSQALSIKIDTNMHDLGKSNFPGFTRGQAKHESKGKEPMQEARDKNIKELNKKIEAIEATYTNQLKYKKN